MNLKPSYWDTSALVPLLLPEAKGKVAMDAWAGSGQAWSWGWTVMEVDAALTRRRAEPGVWAQWQEMECRFLWARMDLDEIPGLRAMNRGMGLRSADAGHLFVFERLCRHIPHLSLISFDQEMLQAAQRLGLAVHPACLAS